MVIDAYTHLVNYFNNLAEQMRGEVKLSTALRNPTAVGTEREESFRRLLERHLPHTCEVFRGGYLFDIQGTMSKQIDVIVTAGTAPRFEMPSQGQAIAPLEGTIAVAEVKSNLNRERLYQALENIASIPRLPEPESAMAPYIKRPPKEFWWDWPYKVIFACDAVSKESLLRNVVEFYESHPHIPQESRPSMIYVLGQYLAVRMHPGLQVMDPDGSVPEGQPAAGEYRWFDNAPDLTALVFTLTEIQKRAFLTNHMIWKYDEWINPLINRILNTQS